MKNINNYQYIVFLVGTSHFHKILFSHPLSHSQQEDQTYHFDIQNSRIQETWNYAHNKPFIFHGNMAHMAWHRQHGNMATWPWSHYHDTTTLHHIICLAYNICSCSCLQFSIFTPNFYPYCVIFMPRSFHIHT